MTTDRQLRLLIKMPVDAAAVRPSRSLQLAGTDFDLEVLCKNEHLGRSSAALAGGSRWFLAKSQAPAGSAAEAWEVAYEAMRARPAALAGQEFFVEPDLEQSWLYQNPLSRNPEFRAAPGELCVFNDQVAGFGTGPGFAWHLRPEYSDLAAARTTAGAEVGKVRIGILDVGFDLQHKALPEHLRLDLGRNFADDGRSPNDVSDPYSRDLLDNPGHGTGTIGILAGRRLEGMMLPEQNTGDFLGGAPHADIVPVRIADSVILLRTSAFVRGLDYLLAPGDDPALRVDVVSMSMGGLASRSWAEAVNRAYDAGIVMVMAAGNNVLLSPQSVVFPARFRRVLAACGIMADGRPYTREFVPLGKMAGNYGPESKMATALSAHTPNIAWAEINCAGLIDMDGAGTSSATPQIAAAAAIWLQRHKEDLAGYAPWEVVEATRQTLFQGARAPDPSLAKYLGRGVLNASATVALPAPAPETLLRTPEDSAAFAFLRGLFGVGVAPDPLDGMLEIELTQLFQREAQVEVCVPDPDVGGRLSADSLAVLVEAVIESHHASPTLKARLKGLVPHRPGPPPLPPLTEHPAPSRAQNREVPRELPRFRRLRTYAFDPALSTRLETAQLNEVVLQIPWDDSLSVGPSGEYVQVIDHDPASGCFYAPVDLNDPLLLAADGLAPSEANPQFHQQMVYAVTMQTIANFERALGRKTLWSARRRGSTDREYVAKLRIYPHALRERNAYFDPEKKALLFGYFRAAGAAPGEQYPGEMIYTCLSADIVAHETTHALLDGMHPNFLSATNPDVLAFHEAFADLVALFQHFSLPRILDHQIARTRGDLRLQNLLGELAGQFGLATGLHGALRSAIGRMQDGEWVPLKPDPAAYARTSEPHARGAILVAAVFDAFLAIYERRSADLVRLATGGTGTLPSGAIHPDLVGRLADEVAKTAQHVLNMCVRALDYLPPVDVTFSDFLRALITADADLVANDTFGYRVAFVEAFRRRGIFPEGARTLSVETARWRGAHDSGDDDLLAPVLKTLQRVADEFWYLEERKRMFDFLRTERRKLHERLQSHFKQAKAPLRDRLMLALGLDLRTGDEGFEVHALRFAEKLGPEGSGGACILISLLQSRTVEMARLAESRPFRGGCTIVADLKTATVRYFVSKNVLSTARQSRQEQFHIDQATSLDAMYFGASPFAGSGARLAMLHAHSEDI